MGNSQTKQNLIPKQWEKVDTDNGLEIYRNVKTQDLAERRMIVLDSEVNVEKEIKLYKMRENNNDALVRAFGSAQLSKSADSFVSCAGQNKIFVLTEKMPHRLSELPQLTFPQSLLFLGESLRAFDKIYRQYGPVQVSKQMIGLNYLGEVKSWLNSNWALNHRSVEYNKLRSKKVSQLSRQQYLAYRQQYLDQQQIIKSIISVIEQKCEDGRFPQAFKQQVISQSGSFKKLLLYLSDFIEYNQIYVPNRINYEELVQVKYPVRLQQQLNFNVQKAHSQVAANGLRPGQNLNMVNNESQHGLFNTLAGGQQISHQVQPTSTEQTFSNKSIGYQTSSLQQNSPFGGGKQLLTGEAVKQSPAASDIGQVTFSQSTRNYNQQLPLSANQNQTQTSNYQWSSSKIDNLYGGSLGNPQQVGNPIITNKTQTENYTFGGLLNNQSEPFKYETYKPSTTSTGYQSYSTGYVALNQPTPITSTNPEQSYSYSGSKFTLPTYSTSQNTHLQTKPLSTNNLTGYNLSNNTLNYTSNTFTSTQPVNNNFAIGTLDSTKGYQNPTSLGYGNIDQNYTLSNNLSNTNQWKYTAPLTTTTNYVSETFSYTGPKINETSQNVTQKYSGYSFDGKQDLASRFGTGYTGSGYSNVLTKYETETSNPPINNISQGKYVEAFNSLLSPSLQGHTFVQETSVQQQQANPEQSRASNIITTNQQKRESSSNFLHNLDISHSNFTQHITSSQQEKHESNLNPIQAFSKMVERASNDVSQSVLKME